MQPLNYIQLLSALILLLGITLPIAGQQKHVYLANDNHSDIFWTADEKGYELVALHEIDYYLDLADQTANLPGPYQSRYNLDGAWYAYVYQKNKNAQEFQRLIDQIKSGHISLPLNHVVSTYGGQPTEAILRGMYWSGMLERQYDLDLDLAVSMENQTQPLGLAALWAGSGAKYSWKGVCGCTTVIPELNLNHRENEIYKYQGLDGTFLIMKWYGYNNGSYTLGGYAEARNLPDAIRRSIEKCNTSDYPYLIAGAFGNGGDDLELLTDVFPKIAQNESSSERQIYVSNETDFFEHFLSAYDPDQLPVENVTYGNEWDLNSATLAPITAKVRRSVEKLRTAEATASLVSLVEPGFYQGTLDHREQAWIALGTYWEHNLGLSGCCYPERNDWQIELQIQISDHADALTNSALERLAANIDNPTTNTRFFVYNPLGWARTDYADVRYDGGVQMQVRDLSTNTLIPFQMIEHSSASYLRILAKDVPGLGYRVYEIQEGGGSTGGPAGKLDGRLFENALYQLTVTASGVITSILDKKDDEEYVKADNGRFVNDMGQGKMENGSLNLISNGPVSSTLQCISNDPLQHTTWITLYKDIDRIDIENLISDAFGDEIRTYSFSFDLENPVTWHEELGSVLKVKYQNNGGHYANADQPVNHNWQTLNHFVSLGTEGKRITLSNQDASFMKLGASGQKFLDENATSVQVLIGGIIYDTGNSNVSNQHGLTEFTNSFSLRTSRNKFDPASEMKFALEHQNPLATGMIDQNVGELPATKLKFLSVSDPNIVTWTLKPAEEGLDQGGIILRAWNMDEVKREVTFDFGPQIMRAFKTSHIETDIMPLAVSEGNLKVEIGKQKLETFRLFFDNTNLITDLEEKIKKKVRINLSPNPASDQLYIDISGNSHPLNMKVFRLDGQLLLQRKIKKPKEVLDVSIFPTGVYFFSFEGKEETITKKIIVSHL